MRNLAVAEDKQKRRDDRTIVTPYAFSVDTSLLGTPLASPTRRAVALLIDLLFVSMLTNVSSMFLAAIVAIVFFRAGNRLKQKKRFNLARILLRLLAALMLFIFALGLFDAVRDEYGEVTDHASYYSDKDWQPAKQGAASEVDGMEALGIVMQSAKYLMKVPRLREDIASGQCDDGWRCWQELGGEVADQINQLPVKAEEKVALTEAFLTEVEQDLSAQQIEQLRQQMTSQPDTPEETHAEPVEPSPEAPPEPATEKVGLAKPQTDDDEDRVGILVWAKALAEDLGIGFGWAAIYFTALTVWLKGQSPGKKILGIKIIRLDGKTMNMWESFERYGGYGAGLATGLLGFLQIFWDPNRQAIHDKISETLVIDLRKPKQTLEHWENGESPASTA